MDVQDKINKVLDKAKGKAEASAVDYVDAELEKSSSSTTKTATTKSDKVNANDTLSKAAKSAQTETEKVLKAEQDALDKKIKEFNTKDAAQKVVNDALDKMIDDAVKQVKKDKGSKTQEELDQQIKEIIRGHKNATFNSDKLLSTAVQDTKKQLDYMIDKQVKELVNTEILDQAMRPLNVALHQKIDLKISAQLEKTIRFDVIKSMSNAINGVIKDPLRDVSITLNKLHLDSLNKTLNTQVGALQNNLAKSITKGISSRVAAEEKKVAAVQKQIVEVQKQVMAFEQKLRDQVKALQNEVNQKLKEVENKMVDEIKKSIKIKI